MKLWLWKNFVDGKPEYLAFDNPFPVHMDCGDPQTLGEPCGSSTATGCARVSRASSPAGAASGFITRWTMRMPASSRTRSTSSRAGRPDVPEDEVLRRIAEAKDPPRRGGLAEAVKLARGGDAPIPFKRW